LVILQVNGLHANKKMKLIVSIIVGVILGVIGSRYLFVGSALSLIPWGIVGLVLGWWNKPIKGALVNGSLYGFFLAFSFMMAGYQGSASIISRIPFFAILGILGAVCGFFLSAIGNFAKKKLKPHNGVL
jgi:hypothetical protein